MKLRWFTAVLLGVAACAADPQHVPEIGFDLGRDACAGAMDCINRGAHASSVDGISVIHKRVAGEPMVSIRLAFDGGATRWSALQGFAESMLMMVIDWWGSTDHVRTWNEDLARIGADVTTHSGVDFGVISMEVPAVHFVEGWRLLVSTVLKPPIPPAVDHLVDVQRHAYETERDDPDQAANLAAWALIAHGHPYDKLREGVGTLDQLSDYNMRDAQAALLVKKRMTIVVVGDVERERVEQFVDAAFGDLLPDDHLLLQPLPPFRLSDQRTDIIDRPDSPNWHIYGYFAAPPAGHADYAALQLGLSALSSRLFDEIRSKRALVYSIGASISNYRRNSGRISLATERPALAMAAVHEVIDDVLAHGFDDAEIDAQRALSATGFYADNQTPVAVAFTMLNWQLTSGDRMLIGDYLTQLQNVSPEEAQLALVKYFKDLRYGAAGPGGMLSESDLLGTGAPDAGTR